MFSWVVTLQFIADIYWWYSCLVQVCPLMNPSVLCRLMSLRGIDKTLATKGTHVRVWRPMTFSVRNTQNVPMATKDHAPGRVTHKWVDIVSMKCLSTSRLRQNGRLLAGDIFNDVDPYPWCNMTPQSHNDLVSYMLFWCDTNPVYRPEWDRNRIDNYAFNILLRLISLISPSGKISIEIPWETRKARSLRTCSTT